VTTVSGMRSTRRHRSAFHCPHPAPSGARFDGFTLIELVVVMAVVAILAAVAFPAYFDQVRRGHRAAAQSALLDLAARQKQFLIDRRAYAAGLADLGIVAPPGLEGRYELAFEAAADATPPTFRLVATPVGSQAADRCGALAVDQAGTRTPAGCW
jgi:type IV pilus assembly protein PilE